MLQIGFCEHGTCSSPLPAPVARLTETHVRRALNWIAPVALLAAGVWQCRAVGEAINADGVSYLDLAQQYATGDWSAVQNGYWSPLYPIVIGLALRALGWTGLSELSIAYGINLILLLVAARAFAWLLDDLASASPGATGVPTPRRFNDGWSRGAAWALFAWMAVRLTGIATITPDMLVAALAFAATALLARRLRGPVSRWHLVAFGALLGGAYTAKAVMFPTALVFLAMFAWVARARGTGSMAREVIAASAAFLLIALPLVLVQSRTAGHLSIGETGRLNYAWHVNSALPTLASVADAGVPRRTATALESIGGAQIFVDSVPGSYPYWYDPARWSAGVHARADLAEQVLVLRVTSRWYRTVAGLPAAGVLLLLALALEARRRPRLALWPLLAAPATLLALYALIHVEGRLVGAALIIVLIVTMAMADADDGMRQSRSRELVLAGLIAFAMLSTARHLARGPRLPPTRDATAVATHLRHAGVTGGVDVAIVGSPLDQGSYWAHLVDVRIVATIPVTTAHRATAGARESLIDEACVAGRRIRAVVWRDSTLWRESDARSAGDGWVMWLPQYPRSGCRL